MDDTGTTAEATHPPGILVEIVGIEKGDRGRLQSNVFSSRETATVKRGRNIDTAIYFHHSLSTLPPRYFRSGVFGAQG
jgi:hypothetical protein